MEGLENALKLGPDMFYDYNISIFDVEKELGNYKKEQGNLDECYKGLMDKLIAGDISAETKLEEGGCKLTLSKVLMYLFKLHQMQLAILYKDVISENNIMKFMEMKGQDVYALRLKGYKLKHLV